MFEGIILGIIQGIVEWLPVSSEGVLVLVQSLFLGEHELEDMIGLALVLHLGTALAATVYFRRDIIHLLKSLFGWKEASQEQKNIILFLSITSVISGLLGFSILELVLIANNYLSLTGQLLLIVVGVLLLGTGAMQLVAKQTGGREAKEITLIDIILLGVVQALAALPGISRSGFTVAALLLRNYSNAFALKLSFLMSIPVVLGGSIAVGIQNSLFNTTVLLGLLFSFIFGIATIHILLQLAKRVRFGYFVFAFGILTILAAFI
tara:strand:- start:20 stop:811 length:792 start_codon:yes stop_codon:yes gene_type:complete